MPRLTETITDAWLSVDIAEDVPIAAAVVCFLLSLVWFARLSGTRDPLARYDEPYTPEPSDDEDTWPLPAATTVRARNPLRTRARQA